MVGRPDLWFSPAAPAARAADVARLFCFPFAGGSAAAFLPWQGSLGPRVQLRVALLPGRGNRLFETPLRDLDELVAQLARSVADLADRPFAVFGHSLGALVAFEVTRALRRQGSPGPSSLWVAGAEAPQTRLVRRRLHELADDELVEALREYNGTPPELLEDRDMMRLLMPGLRADFALDECYAYRPEPPLDLPIHVLLGDHDPHVDPERAAGWALESTRPLRRHDYDGDHFFVHGHRDPIAALLQAGLATPSPREDVASWRLER
jgi:medium-chain acyl-[acyl-carrier-protein] hydrolase